MDSLSKKCRNDILVLIPEKYKKKYSKLISRIFHEIEIIYMKEKKGLGIKNAVYFEKDHYQKLITNFGSYKLYKDKFIKNRSLLMKNYFLSHEIIRNIIQAAQVTLPKIICDLKKYQHCKIITLSQLQSICTKEINRSALFITSNFYNETYKAIIDAKTLKNMPTKRLIHFLQCVTNVFVQQIILIMINSIDNIINLMENKYS